MILISNPDKSQWQEILKRPVMNTENLFDTVRSVIDRVKEAPKQCIPFNGFNFMPVNPDQAFFIPVSMDDAEKYEKRSRGTGPSPHSGKESPVVRGLPAVRQIPALSANEWH